MIAAFLIMTFIISQSLLKQFKGQVIMFHFTIIGELKHDNLTLEQDVLKELMGLRCSYAVVLTANKKKDLHDL